jgi:hypothetical protein
MQVTAPLKRRFAAANTIAQSYSLGLEQTFKFPLNRPADLRAQADENLQAVRTFLAGLPQPPDWSDSKGPVWVGVSADAILDFLRRYRIDADCTPPSVPLICAYIERQVERGELVRWTVAVRGREAEEDRLGEADWGVAGGHLWQISRTRIKDTNSLGVITSPGDEALGLSEAAREEMARRRAEGVTENRAARMSRPAEEGLLLLYPISRRSGHDLGETGNRRGLFEDPDGPDARDLIGLAISFPSSHQPQLAVTAYLEGTVGWRPVE